MYFDDTIWGSLILAFLTTDTKVWFVKPTLMKGFFDLIFGNKLSRAIIYFLIIMQPLGANDLTDRLLCNQSYACFYLQQAFNQMVCAWI